MLTPHETAVEHLKLLNRSDHPEIEEILAVVRQYPVEIQRACEDAMKRGEDAAVLYPVKSIADRHAVALQELLDALTATMPHRVDLMRAAEPSLADRQLGEQSPHLPGTEDDLLWRQQHGRSLPGEQAMDPRRREGEFVSGFPDAAAGTFGGAPFTQSGLTPNPESGRSGLDTSQAAAPFVDPAHPLRSVAEQEIEAMRAKLEDGVDASEIRRFTPPSALLPHETANDGEVIRSEPFLTRGQEHDLAKSNAELAAKIEAANADRAASETDDTAARMQAESERAAQNANMGGHPVDEPLPTSKL